MTARGAEPWKIKLFVDTGMALKPGKHYKITADVRAEVAQDFEVCYNSGSAEMGCGTLIPKHTTTRKPKQSH